MLRRERRQLQRGAIFAQDLEFLVNTPMSPLRDIEGSEGSVFSAYDDTQVVLLTTGSRSEVCRACGRGCGSHPGPCTWDRAPDSGGSPGQSRM